MSAPGLVELGCVVGGEVLLSEHLVRAEADREDVVALDLVRLVVRCRIGLVALVVVEDQGDRLDQHVDRAGRHGSPEGVEHPVIGGDVLGPTDQRGPAGPVERGARFAVEGADRLDERDGAADRLGQAGVAQLAHERRPAPAPARSWRPTCAAPSRPAAPSPSWRARCLVLAVLEHAAERRRHRRLVELGRVRAAPGPGPSRSSRPRPAACTCRAARNDSVAAATWRASRSGTSGARSRTMATSRSKSGCSTQW